MKLSVIMCCTLAFCGVGIACASVPPKSPEKAKPTAVAVAKPKAVAEARHEARALGAAQLRAVANYRRNQSRVVAEAKRQQARANAAAAGAAQQAKNEAHALARAQDRAVANYRRNQSRVVAEAKRDQARANAAAARAAQQAKNEAHALAKAQDRVVAYYNRSLGRGSGNVFAKAMRKIETLACFTGVQDRHARIGVELVNGKVNYFAYYSKWKPRTCSIAAERHDPYSRWEDSGSTSKVTLVDNKGVFMIDREGGSYRFVFRDVDRMRYCGMSGKINGSLTVMRGKGKCVVKGVMDGHEG
jgi:hypothetical protein